MIAARNREDIDQMYDLVKGFLSGTLREIMIRLQAERGSLFLFDPDRRELILDACYNPANLKFKGVRQRLNQGVSGAVVNLKTAVLVKDIASDSRFKSNRFRQYHTPSFISVPLYIDAGLIGIIHIGDKSAGRIFSETDFAYTKQLCAYACTIVANLCDFSRLRREKSAVERQKQLLQQYAAVGKMAREIVHAISNPLDGAARFANILIRDARDGSKARESLGCIAEGLEKIRSIVGTLREFGSHMGRRRHHGGAVSANEVIENALKMFGERIARSYSVSRQFDSQIPRIPNYGLEHLCMNMIKNALDVMPGGGSLTVRTAAESGMLVMVFSDTGCGISPADQKLVFEPFFTTKQAGQGTGLGLSICKEVVDKYNGSIRLQSRAGSGTTFRIELPVTAHR